MLVNQAKLVDITSLLKRNQASFWNLLSSHFASIRACEKDIKQHVKTTKRNKNLQCKVLELTRPGS